MRLHLIFVACFACATPPPSPGPIAAPPEPTEAAVPECQRRTTPEPTAAAVPESQRRTTPEQPRAQETHPAQQRRTPPAQQRQKPPNRGRQCERENDRCWRCADIEFPAKVPCTGQRSCDGVCIEQYNEPLCLPTGLFCCAEPPCNMPPGCKAASGCSDIDGDGHNDMCTFLSPCTPPVEVGTVFDQPPPPPCKPWPEIQDYPDTERPKPEQSACRPTPLSWKIPAEKMRTGASDHTGEGLCFGVVHFDAAGRPIRSCGKYHCQTLRYCDGRERAMYCTVRAVCENGQARATGFTW